MKSRTIFSNGICSGSPHIQDAWTLRHYSSNEDTEIRNRRKEESSGLVKRLARSGEEERGIELKAAPDLEPRCLEL